MRFYYLDPGLKDNIGHHANTCRNVTGELRRRGIETIIAGNVDISGELKTEFGTIPLFNFFTYWSRNRDPIAGWLTVFMQGVTITTHDLTRLPQPTAGDVVYLNSTQPVQLMSLVNWLHNMPKDRRPRVVTEFGTDAGLEVKQEGDQLTFLPMDPRLDPRSVLYRYVGENTPADVRKHLFLMTFDPMASQGYQFIIGHQIGVLPLPQAAYAPLRRKTGKRPITVAVMGHQRADKGYHFMPEIIHTLITRHHDIHVLAHNAAPDQMPDVQQSIRQLAAMSSRVIVDERPANDKLWHYLFAGTDIVLCPYQPSRYLTAYSAIVAEALANGLPVVVPGGTSLSRFLADHGGAGIAFNDYTAQSISDATSTAILSYDALADRAFAAAEAWNSRDRKALLVDRILG